MREHEVPTHVQAEDRVLLGFTFPQIVAVTAVCAISYGAYRYAPVGPSEVRMALAVVFGTRRRGDGGGEDRRSGGCPWWPPTFSSTGWGRGSSPGRLPSW